jgi:hypothetical protein
VAASQTQEGTLQIVKFFEYHYSPPRVENGKQSSIPASQKDLKKSLNALQSEQNLQLRFALLPIVADTGVLVSVT